jgi:hypothetical protein
VGKFCISVLICNSKFELTLISLNGQELARPIHSGGEWISMRNEPKYEVVDILKFNRCRLYKKKNQPFATEKPGKRLILNL